jgi:hypothetical protein
VTRARRARRVLLVPPYAAALWKAAHRQLCFGVRQWRLGLDAQGQAGSSSDCPECLVLPVRLGSPPSHAHPPHRFASNATPGRIAAPVKQRVPAPGPRLVEDPGRRRHVACQLLRAPARDGGQRRLQGPGLDSRRFLPPVPASSGAKRQRTAHVAVSWDSGRLCPVVSALLAAALPASPSAQAAAYDRSRLRSGTLRLQRGHRSPLPAKASPRVSAPRGPSIALRAPGAFPLLFTHLARCAAAVTSPSYPQALHATRCLHTHVEPAACRACPSLDPDSCSIRPSLFAPLCLATLHLSSSPPPALLCCSPCPPAANPRLCSAVTYSLRAVAAERPSDPVALLAHKLMEYEATHAQEEEGRRAEGSGAGEGADWAARVPLGWQSCHARADACVAAPVRGFRLPTPARTRSRPPFEPPGTLLHRAHPFTQAPAPAAKEERHQQQEPVRPLMQAWTTRRMPGTGPASRRPVRAARADGRSSSQSQCGCVRVFTLFFSVRDCLSDRLLVSPFTRLE